MEAFEKSRISAFLDRITACFPVGEPIASIVITHLLAERPCFLDAVNSIAPIRAVLPKPKSICEDVYADVRERFPVDRLSRRMFADTEAAVEYLEEVAAGQRLVLLDVGGYFAHCLNEMCTQFSGSICGVIEDTENGLRRYRQLDKLPCPVFSVARSPLKEPEDLLVGQSIVFSAEALIRERGDIITGRDACVIGFGKLGEAIAHVLHSKKVHVTIYDDDTTKMVQALAQGFRVASTRTDAIRGADLVVCATGNLALRQQDFSAVRNGAYIASVTSSDDELELEALHGLYRRSARGPHLIRYATAGHYFYVMADGNAVNFLHGASVGTFIHLVQAEILAAISQIIQCEYGNEIHEVDTSTRQFIATTWLDYFNE